MKKVYIIIGSILFLWIIYMGVEYFRCYKPDITDNKPFITFKTEDNEEYTKDISLGFSIIHYKLNIDEAKEGSVVKEFNVLGISFSDTTLVRKKK